MKKFINIFLAVLITLFSFPFGGLKVSAAEKIYDDIEDGEYEVTVKALEKNSDKTSAADGFLIETATLIIDDNNISLKTKYTKDFAMDYGINWTKIEGKDPSSKNEDEKEYQYTFMVEEVKSTYSASMNYYVSGMPGDMGDQSKGHSVDYRIVIDENDLEKLPKDDQAEEERTVGQLVSESEVDKVYTVNFDSDSSSTKGQLQNPAKLLVKGDKEYIQISVSDRGAPLFRSLKFNGEEVVWNSITEGPYKIQYELTNGIEETIDVSMVIQAGPNVMPHDNIKLWFDQDSLELVKDNETPENPDEETPEQAEEERKVGELVSESTADEVYTVNFDSDSNSTKGQLQNPAKLLVKDDKEYIQISVSDRGAPLFRSLKFNDEEVIWNSITEGPYKIQYELTNGIEETIDVSMVIQAGPNVMPHDNIKLWFDQDSLELVKDNDTPENPEQPGENENEGKDEEETEKDNESDVEEDAKVLTPDKAYEINYTILNENGKETSVADGFFKKPGVLLEKDGKTYLQLTVNSAEMVQSLSNKYGDYVLVDEKDGKRTMQLRVPNSLSNMKLNMFIVVPGLYEEAHAAILSFDKNSKQEVDTENYQLVATNDKDNGNAPFDKEAEPTPTPDPTPEPGKDNGKGQDKTNNKKPNKENEEVTLTPEKAYEINYTILHEDGSGPSVADGFFKKPGTLLEYDGKTYFQMTVESAEMVKALSNQYGDYILVSKNADGTMTIQLRVPNDLSDVKLDMHIVVPAGAIPGFPGYDEKHGAILTFDKDSKKEVSVDGLEVAASGDKNNENGPYVEGATPGKPSFDDNNSQDGGKKAGANGNPKTGDTSQILFFTMLLISSFGVLAFQLRRRIA